jgi:hypothetical protein
MQTTHTFLAALAIVLLAFCGKPNTAAAQGGAITIEYQNRKEIRFVGIVGLLQPPVMVEDPIIPVGYFDLLDGADNVVLSCNRSGTYTYTPPTTGGTYRGRITSTSATIPIVSHLLWLSFLLVSDNKSQARIYPTCSPLDAVSTYETRPNTPLTGYIATSQSIIIPAAPTISTVSTNLVCANAPITINGANMQNVGAVTMGGVPVQSFTANGSGSLTVIAGTGVPSGQIVLHEAHCRGLTVTTPYITIKSIPNLQVTAYPSSTVCTATNVYIQATGAPIYIWNGVNNQLDFRTTTTPITYNVVATGAYGCTASATLPINFTNNPTVSIVADRTNLCLGQNTTVYTQSSDNNFVTLTSTNNLLTNTAQTITPTATGISTYTATLNITGCPTVSASANINTIALPNLMATPLPNSYCEGSSVTLQASGATNYTWNGTPAPNGTLPITASTTQTYTVVGTNGGICSATATQTVNVLPAPNVTASVAPSTTVCEGTTIMLQATGNAVGYQWANATAAGSTDTRIINNPSLYTVIATGSNGCTRSAAQLVLVNPAPLFTTANASATQTCAGQTVTLSANSVGAIPLNTTPPTGYCTAKGLGAGNLSDVFFHTIANSYHYNVSNNGGNAYQDFTNTHIATVTPGNTYPITVVIPTNYSTTRVEVWFDFNRNTVFDANEKFDLTTADAAEFTANITIPTNAASGRTRFRLIIKDAGQTGACGTFYDGNNNNIDSGVEDYGLQINIPYNNTLVWAGGIAANNAATVNPVTTTTYTVTATDVIGCTNTQTFNIAIQSPPIDARVSTANNICANNPAVITTGSSQIGNYYYAESTNGERLSAPTLGTGNGLNITTVPLNANTTVQVKNTNALKALRFDGNDDYLATPVTLSGNGGTWEAWVQKDDWANHHDDRLFSNGLDFGTNGSFYASLHPVVGFHCRYGGQAQTGNNYVASLLTQNFALNSWHHLAVTWAHTAGVTTLKLYIDGALAATNTAVMLLGNSQNIKIGGSGMANETTYFGAGKMYDIQVWNRAKTPAEIAANFIKTAEYNETGLLAAYKCNETSGNTASDASQNNNNATLTNINAATAWQSGNLCPTTVLTLSQTPNIAISNIATSSETETKMISSTITYFGNGCAIATVQPYGANPVNGSTTAKVWIDNTPNTAYAKRHFEITPDNNATNATANVTLYFTQADFDDYNALNTRKLPINATDLDNNKANILIEKRSGTSSNGTGEPNTYAGSIITIDPDDTNIVWNTAADRWEVTFAVTGFSGFFIKTTPAPLPVKLLSFSGYTKNSTNILEWRTATELNNAYFEVQKSTNGIYFENIGQIRGAGTTNTPQNYTFTDHQPNREQGTSSPFGGQRGYYRLCQIDFDGAFSYSNTIALRNKSSSSTDIRLYPNPTNSVLNIDIANRNQAISICDALGRVVYTNTNIPNTIDVSEFENGVYVVTIADEVFKMVKF